ncbi:peptidylprolyl isomerase [Marinicrinis lubricantis]|uniref:peptidylprolyl isomerase n=1 Tax=Marinicrinis lubricantis TaxID=2086470 RepID=A0ABW1IQG1_9BACL
MRQPKRNIPWLVLLLAGILLLSACGGNNENNQNSAQGGGDGQAVAEYTLEKDGGEVVKVTQEEFDQFKGMKKVNDPYFEQRAALSETFEEDLLKQYVAVKILESQTSAEEMDQLKKEADEAYATITEQLNANEQLKEQWNSLLESNGLSEEEYKQYMLLQNNAITQLEKSITEDEMKKQYEERIAADPYAYLTSASVSHILITAGDTRTSDEALELAEEVKQKLDDGGDFAALAQQYSEDPGSKDNGGSYVDADINQWDADFRKAVLELPVGQISDPVETQFGYHIIRVDKRDVPTFEDASVQEIVKGELVEKKFQDFLANDLGSYLKEIDLPEE